MKLRVKVVVSKCVVVDGDKWNDICAEDGMKHPFTKQSILQYVKKCLIEELENNPNRGSCSIEIVEA